MRARCFGEREIVARAEDLPEGRRQKLPGASLFARTGESEGLIV